MSVWSGSMQAFAARFPRYGANVVRSLGKAGTDEVFDASSRRIRDTTPIRSGALVRDYREVRRADGSRALENTATYFNIINRGRRRGFTPRGQKRVRRKKGMKVNKQAPMLGSKQAPRGMRRPAIRYVMGDRERLLRRIFDKAERVQP